MMLDGLLNVCYPKVFQALLNEHMLLCIAEVVLLGAVDKLLFFFGVLLPA